MKKLVSLLLCILVIFPAFGQANQAVADFLVWEQENSAKAKNGSLNWSAYFAEAFTKVSALPSHPDRTARMQLYSEGIPIARKYESRKLSKIQFEDELRKVYVLVLADHERNMQTLQAQQQLRREQLQTEEEQRKTELEQRQAQELARQQELANQQQQIELQRRALEVQQQLALEQQLAQQQSEQARAAKEQEFDVEKFLRGVELGRAIRRGPERRPRINCTSDTFFGTVTTTCR